MPRKQATADNALLEGGDVEEQPPTACIPVTRDEIYARLDHVLRQRNCALLATPQPRTGPLDPQQYWLFEVELKDGGRVSRIDLIKRARELGLVEAFETPTEHWQGRPA
jgi:hypothetical protein